MRFKKYLVVTMCLLTMGVSFAMELAAGELTTEQDYQCYWVACYLEKCSNVLNPTEQRKVQNFFQQSTALSQRVQGYQKSIGEIDKEVEGFIGTFNAKHNVGSLENYYLLSSGARYRVAFFFERELPRPDGLCIAYILNEGKDCVFCDIIENFLSISYNQGNELPDVLKPEIKKTERHLETESYAKMHSRALLKRNGIVWPDYKRQSPHINKIDTLEFLVRRDDDATISSFEMSFESDEENFPIGIFNEIYEEHHRIKCSFSFWLRAMPYARLLCDICRESTIHVKRTTQLGCLLTMTDIEQLRTLHKQVQSFEEWKSLQQASIDIDFSSKTGRDKLYAICNALKDRLLLAIPLFLVEGLIPTALVVGLQKGNFGKLMHVLGIIPCISATGFVGKVIYPFFDAYNSGVCRLRAIFGERGVRRIENPKRFMWYGGMHYLLTIISQYLLPVNFSMGLYFSRLVIYIYNIMSTKYTDNDGKNNFLGKMAFHNPLLRRNKEGKYFRLSDILISQ